jgi:hypothetical protein
LIHPTNDCSFCWNPPFLHPLLEVLQSLWLLLHLERREEGECVRTVEEGRVLLDELLVVGIRQILDRFEALLLHLFGQGQRPVVVHARRHQVHAFVLHLRDVGAEIRDPERQARVEELNLR